MKNVLKKFWLEMKVAYTHWQMQKYFDYYVLADIDYAKAQGELKDFYMQHYGYTWNETN